MQFHVVSCVRLLHVKSCCARQPHSEKFSVFFEMHHLIKSHRLLKQRYAFPHRVIMAMLMAITLKHKQVLNKLTVDVLLVSYQMLSFITIFCYFWESPRIPFRSQVVCHFVHVVTSMCSECSQSWNSSEILRFCSSLQMDC